MNLSHKYSRGYAMLEPKTLKMMMVPDPSSIPPSTMKTLQILVEKCIQDPSAIDADYELDRLVAGLYGLTSSERQAIGMKD